MRTALLIGCLLLSGCTVAVGKGGRLYSGALANGFCIEATLMSQSGSLGHCGTEGEDPELEDPNFR